MTDTFEFTLNNPLTEEQLDQITDVDMERTNSVTFHTKHGKKVKFVKVTRCSDCKYWNRNNNRCAIFPCTEYVLEDDYCGYYAERKEE